MLDDWCDKRCLKLHFVHVLVVSDAHVHVVVMGLVEYGSVKGVCGSNMVSVVPTRAMASLSISPVDLSMSAIVVWVVMAVFVRMFPCSIRRSSFVVIVSFVMFVVRCIMEVGDWIRAASMSDAIRRVRSNL